MGHHFASRVEIAETPRWSTRRAPSGRSRLRPAPGQPTDQIDELALGVLLDAVGEQLGILPERRRQLRPAFLAVISSFGVGHRVVTGVLTASGSPLRSVIRPLVRRDGDMPHATRVALALEEVAVDHVQVDDSPDDGADHRQQQAGRSRRTAMGRAP